MQLGAPAAELLIVEGQNGTGKTTIMKMISGIVNGLDFDIFRQVPFGSAHLELSDGHVVSVYYDETNEYAPIRVTFGEHVVNLIKDKTSFNYTKEEIDKIDLFRSKALPVLGSIDFELITIERSVELSKENVEFEIRPDNRVRTKSKTLAVKVRDFLRDAQVNYRRFFQAEELELLPRIIKQFASLKAYYNSEELLGRVRQISANNSKISHYGLQTDDAELQTLTNLLENNSHSGEQHALSLLASYVEIHENKFQARNLIANRLFQFEEIMDEFFVGKSLKISVRNGFEIHGATGRISERDLSSGEYHFLYMMVAALLCERAGTIIAIDEPELSLHVSWQRRLIYALSKCAAGASPIFFLSTHSTAISSAYKPWVKTLSVID